jgi:hypothetical protein
MFQDKKNFLLLVTSGTVASKYNNLASLIVHLAISILLEKSSSLSNLLVFRKEAYKFDFLNLKITFFFQKFKQIIQERLNYS